LDNELNGKSINDSKCAGVFLSLDWGFQFEPGVSAHLARSQRGFQRRDSSVGSSVQYILPFQRAENNSSALTWGLGQSIIIKAGCSE